MRIGFSISSCAVSLGLFAAACGPSGSGSTDGGGGGAGGSGGAGGGEPAPLVIETDKGPVEGGVLGSTRVFFGIPFAAPPVGDLRWKPPQPHAAWTDKRDATKKARMCAQTNPLNGGFISTSEEDCLTLNVWTPQKPASDRLPVLVWIHGGAFRLGSGSDVAYDGRAFSEATGTVVVTVSYRLGPLGFLALPDLASEDPAHPSTGNYGLEDQRAALEWVKANIEAFGGDPGKVTLFGESAGGISTCLHMVSPESKGLFQRAIVQSGPCDSVTDATDAEKQGAAFVEALGCTDAADVLACLRGKSTEEVVTALPTTADFLGDGVKWFPVLDGWNVPDVPSSLLASGKLEKVPTILGSNADEGTIFLALASTMIPDDAAFAAMAEALAPGKGAEVVARYPTAEHGSAQAAAAAAIGDAGFVCPTRRAARALADAGVPTYLYHFTYAPTGALLPDLGAFHSAEIKFVLGNPGQLLPKPVSEEELPMSKAIMGYWASHAEKGDPNGGGAFEWPKYDAATDENLVLDLTISKQTGLKKDLCDFWDGVVIDAI